MNRKEALIALLRGAKITHPAWVDGWIVWLEGTVKIKDDHGDIWSVCYWFKDHSEGYEIYRKPEEKVKKWLWVMEYPGGEPWISDIYYSEEDRPRHAIEKLDYSEIEVEE